MFGGYGDPTPDLGGLQVAFQALEALGRNLACELGPHGIRVVTLQTGHTRIGPRRPRLA
jgi:NAD(P)-dependent dehydrogenase (short-subunit alcohol dehydrogenase family)